MRRFGIIILQSSTWALLALNPILGQDLGQNNLVPNPSFEENVQPPTAISQLYLAVPWQGFATDAGSVPADYFHKSSTAEISSVPANYLGFQEPRTGSAYAGFIAFSDDYEYYREFIQVELLEPLTRDTTYYIEFYVSLAENRTLAISDLGCHLSMHDPFSYLFTPAYVSSLKDDETNLLKKEVFTILKAQIKNRPDQILKNQVEWERVSGTVVSRGGERFITIGNFSRRKKTTKEKVVSNPNSILFNDAYYFVDDVSVMTLGNARKPVDLAKTTEPLDTIDNYFADLEINKPITLKNVYFTSDQAELQSESFVELNHLYNLLMQNLNLKIVIEGHTDNTNTELYNLNLSEMRAEAVREYLVNRGIEVSRIETIGLGENQPISDNSTEKGKRLNRRVVFKVIDIEYE